MKQHIPQPPPIFSQVLFHSWLLNPTPSPPMVTRMGTGVVIGWKQFFFAAPSSSCFPVLQPWPFLWSCRRLWSSTRSSIGCSVGICSSLVSPERPGEPLPQHLERSLSSSSDPVSHYFLLTPHFVVFFPSLNTLSRRCHHLCWGAGLCPVVGTLQVEPGAAQPRLRAQPCTWTRTPDTIGKGKINYKAFFILIFFLNPDYHSYPSFLFHSFFVRLSVKPQTEKTVLLRFGLKGLFGGLCMYIHICQPLYHKMLQRPRQACEAEYDSKDHLWYVGMDGLRCAGAGLGLRLGAQPVNNACPVPAGLRVHISNSWVLRYSVWTAPWFISEALGAPRPVHWLMGIHVASYVPVLPAFGIAELWLKRTHRTEGQPASLIFPMCSQNLVFRDFTHLGDTTEFFRLSKLR